LQDSSSKQHGLLSDLTSEALGQAHLFDALDGLGDEEFATRLKELGTQLEELDGAYSGGLRQYILKARKLLEGKLTNSTSEFSWIFMFCCSKVHCLIPCICMSKPVLQAANRARTLSMGLFLVCQREKNSN
jgi:hypothetical protein